MTTPTATTTAIFSPTGGHRFSLPPVAAVPRRSTGMTTALASQSAPALLRLSAMAAKKIPKSVIRAFIERHRMRSVSIVIDDVDTVRVDPAAPGSPTPPWRRRGDAGRMAS
jgi:hypothetical protein